MKKLNLKKMNDEYLKGLEQQHITYCISVIFIGIAIMMAMVMGFMAFSF